MSMSGAAADNTTRAGLGLTPRSAARARRLSLRGAAILYLGLMTGLPVLALLAKGFGDGFSSFAHAITSPGGLAAIRLTLITAAITAVVNAVMGTLLAWVIVRYRFPGRSILSMVADLPIAIPTLVTGIMLVAIYGPGSPVGSFLESIGIQVIFAPLGVQIALLIVTLPFVLRTVQPVLLEIDPAEEEASMTMGAGSWTTFRKVVLPTIRPAIAAGALLSFARATGEFGSVVLVSGNLLGKTLTAPVYIFQLASQFRTEEAAAIASLMFCISFTLVLITSKLTKGNRD